MEDLREKHYKMYSRPFGIDKLKSVLKTLANFHASYTRVYKNHNCQFFDFMIDASVAAAEKLNIKNYVDIRDIIKNKFVEIVKPSNKYRNVICHLDVSMFNVLFIAN